MRRDRAAPDDAMMPCPDARTFWSYAIALVGAFAAAACNAESTQPSMLSDAGGPAAATSGQGDRDAEANTDAAARTAPDAEAVDGAACAPAGSFCGGGPGDPVIACCDPATTCDHTTRACVYPAGGPCDPSALLPDATCASGTSCNASGHCVRLTCLDDLHAPSCADPAFQGIPCCQSSDVCFVDGIDTRCCAPAGATMPLDEVRCCGGYEAYGQNMARCL